ncbi:spermatogenesis-associated protein 13 isoform 5-T5 [Salvelinus alpinus]|uniref:spermatogenesis-associated protein 13 isoform X4 n=1 Tax=Salvelinus alpinus TaxID=8036 RepID=UPI0039FC0DDA
MRRAWQSDGTPSTSEDSLSYRRGSTSDPDLRPPARPLSDLYPLKAHVSMAVPQSLLSGCDAQVQPMTCDFNSEESRLNGFNTANWSSPVIGHPSRIMRLFSTQKKCTVPGDSQGSTRPLSFQGPPSSAGVPQVWPGLSGLTVMGSFKKLRSSVLQGIQNRGTANQDDEYTSAAIQGGDNGMVTTNQSPRLRCGEGYRVSNGVSIGQQMAGLSPYGSDNEDEEVVDEEDGLQRNTWFSRSIRRAYGAGRITLLDTGDGKRGEGPGLGVSTNQRPSSGSGSVSEVNLHLEESVNENVNALSRLSKSADNLHLFKGPFRHKVPCPSPQTDSPGANGDPSIQRTASASSGDLRDRSQSPVRFRSPVGAKGHMLKLVGSMTDLTVRRRPNPSPVTSPGSPVTPLSPLSRLHDDYSRRTPCLPASDRQRRPSPARTRAAAERKRNSTSVRLEHTPTIHPQPQSKYHPALFPIEPQEGPDHVFAFPSINQPFTTTSFSLSARAQRSSLCEGDRPQERQGDGWRARCDSAPHPQGEPCGSHSKHQPDVNAEGKTEPKQCVWTRPDQDQEDQEGRGHLWPLSRPPVPSHQVPPYKAVSARFRPSTFSQSTPIGLDRLGRRKLHRVLSVEADAGSERSAAVDGDSVSEEEGSFDELSDVTTYLQPGVELSALSQWISQGQAVYAEALWDHVTMEEQELAFKAGDVIRVLEAPHKDWWWGMGADREAWFPSSFVRVRVNQEEDSGAESVESCALDQEDAHTDTRDTHTHSAEHREQMRTNVVKEIMNTERIYIKHLRDICEGYIRQCGKHPGMFTELQLKTIFSNIEDIYKFQRQFLKELEKKYNTDQPHLSEIGACFLLQGEGFSIYSEYCNTHPAACGELQRLMKLGRYKHFFEACRLLQQMIDISIAGFLLTPVQKICKYPLQLGELLKYTPKDHSDYGGVSDAYEAMRNVASLINEGKRRLESVDAIAHWQVAILRWEGADVLERSSELIHSGELTRIVRQGNKTQQRSFFLFDHQLVFCKKDVLRRDLLHYRGRLDMDNTSVLQMPDGRDPELGILLRNALRLRNSSTLETLCYLCCRKSQDRQRWLQAFARERQRVQEDQEMGMKISETQRKQAIFNARRSKQGKMKTIGYSGSVPPHHHHHHQPLHPIHQRHVTVPTSVPQQQVFTLAEPKQKPAHLWYTFTRHALFRK